MDNKEENKESAFELEIIDEELDTDTEAKTDQEVAEPDESDESNEDQSYVPESQSTEANRAFAEMRRELEQLKKEQSTPRKSDDEIIADIAFNENIDYEEAKKKYMSDKSNKELKEELEQLKKEVKKTTVSNKLIEYKKMPYFKIIETQFKSIIENDPNVNLDITYNYLVGQNIDKIQKENNKIKTQNKAAKRTVGTSSGTVGDKHKISLTAKELKNIDEKIKSGVFLNREQAFRLYKEYDG